MDETAARALKHIVTQKGHRVVADARLCEALLQDYSPSTRRENMALMEALKDGVPRRFLALPSALSDATIAKLADTLVENTVLSPEMARWAVRSWANALELPVAESKGPPDAKPGPEPKLPLAGEAQKVPITFGQFAGGVLILLLVFAVAAISGFASADVPYVLIGLAALGVFRLAWSWLTPR